jgi:hypothetical protein
MKNKNIKEEIIIKCKYCNSEFSAPSFKTKVCKDCKIENKRDYQLKKIHKRSQELKNGVYIEDYVIDKWSNLAVKNVFGQQFKILYPFNTIQEYKQDFPNEITICSTLSKKFGDAVRGDKNHMKQEKYKKMFSEKFKGQNNPGSKTNTTEKERLERSPYSVDFYLKKGLSETEAKEELIKINKRRVNTSQLNNNDSTKLEYFISRCNNLSEAKKQYKERQTTFTLEKCIQRYGYNEGVEIFNKRNSEWSKKMIKKRSNNEYTTKSYSKPEIDLIESVINIVGIHENMYYKDNQYYLYDDINHKHYSYDYLDTKNKKIIEFNGDYWHMNPKKYKSDDEICGIKASEIWKKDIQKTKLAKKYGFDILVIWESEYKENKNEVINKCIRFLNN